MLAGAPEVVLRVCVAELVGTLDHRLDDVHGVVIQGQHSLASLVLALANVQRLRVQIHVLAADMLDFDTAHRRVRRKHSGAVDVLPFGIALGDLEETVLFFRREHPPDRCAT